MISAFYIPNFKHLAWKLTEILKLKKIRKYCCTFVCVVYVNISEINMFKPKKSASITSRCQTTQICSLINACKFCKFQKLSHVPEHSFTYNTSQTDKIIHWSLEISTNIPIMTDWIFSQTYAEHTNCVKFQHKTIGRYTSAWHRSASTQKI